MNAEIKSNENALIEITNNLGQLIIQQKLDVGKVHTISFEKKLPIGMYQLQLTKNGILVGITTINIY